MSCTIFISATPDFRMQCSDLFPSANNYQNCSLMTWWLQQTFLKNWGSNFWDWWKLMNCSVYCLFHKRQYLNVLKASGKDKNVFKKMEQKWVGTYHELKCVYGRETHSWWTGWSRGSQRNRAQEGSQCWPAQVSLHCESINMKQVSVTVRTREQLCHSIEQARRLTRDECTPG